MRFVTTPKRVATQTDFDRAPQLVTWETTQACEGACRQRGGCTGPKHHPDELTTAEGKALLGAIAAMGTSEVALGGGDPAMRHDLSTLVAHATALGLRVTVASASTAMMTARRLAELRDAGLSRVSVAIDGFNAETHDARSGVDGSFAETLRILGDADALALETRIETALHPANERHLRTISYLVAELGASTWGVTFDVGAFTAGEPASQQRAEELLETLAGIAASTDLGVDTTGAPQLARVKLQRRGRTRRHVRVVDERGVIAGPRSLNDGCGLMFVSHVGDVSPSAWLPLTAGNVRHDDVAAIYRASELFRSLRDLSALEGKCGTCEFRHVCGGSRARAYAVDGSVHASDPLCGYVPTQH